MKTEMTYAELIRRAMRAKGMSRRDLEKAIGFSYEHIRKVVSGLPLMSEDFNEKACKTLGLDANEMWAIAQREKLKNSSRYGALGAMALPDNRLKQLWSDLTAADQDDVIKIIEGIAARRRVEREERDMDDPAKLHQRVMELMQRLGTPRSEPERRRA